MVENAFSGSTTLLLFLLILAQTHFEGTDKALQRCLQLFQNPWAASTAVTALSALPRALFLAASFFCLASQNFWDLSFLLSSRLEMSSCFLHPFWAARSPRTQEFLWDFILRTLRASGTTILFLWSYGLGIPSKTFNLSSAALPLGDLCGSIPLRDLQNILDGDL